MTWSHDPATGYFSSGDAQQNLNNALQLLNGRGDPTTNQGGWQVALEGSNSDYINMLFTFVDLEGVTRHTQSRIYYPDLNYTQKPSGRINENYDPAETDLTLETAWPFKFTPSGNGRPLRWVDDGIPLRVWFSSEDPAGFVITQTSEVVFAFAPASYRVAPYYTDANDYLNIDGENYVQYGQIYPTRETFYGLGNYPLSLSLDYSQWLTLGFFLSSNWQRTDNAFNGLVYNNVPIAINGVSHGQMANDVFYSIPKNRYFSSGVYNSTVPVVATDGSKFYIYTSSTSGQSWVMDCGITDPSAYLFNT